MEKPFLVAPIAGIDMTFDFGQLIAHPPAKTRPWAPGTIIGSGTVSNKAEMTGRATGLQNGGVRLFLHCEIRMIEDIEDGTRPRPFIAVRRIVCRIEMKDKEWPLPFLCHLTKRGEALMAKGHFAICRKTWQTRKSPFPKSCKVCGRSPPKVTEHRRHHRR